MTRVVETDVCIIGGGITGAMVAERLSETTTARILVVEAGSRTTPLDERYQTRQRLLDYGENPWRDNYIPDQDALGINSRSMVLGGWAMHWGGTCPRYTPEDFRLRTLFGVGDDWPLDYDELEPFYQEAEERIGVAGEQGPPELDPRSKPYPMPPVPLSWTLERLKEWGESAGIPFWINPVAKNSVPYQGRNVCIRCDTCEICPTGAKYTPDFTFDQLTAAGRIEVLTRTLVRRLVRNPDSDLVERATAVDRDRPDDPVELRARLFVLAGGYVWAPHLLLLSTDTRFPDGLANSSGLVGKYMTGHRAVSAYVELPLELYPGEYLNHSLISNRFRRGVEGDRYIRHDLRIWESAAGREPRLQDDDGRVLLGDEIVADWRERAKNGAARVRSYYDVLPARNSEVTLHPTLTNQWGDPIPQLRYRDDPVSAELRGWTEERITALFERMARAGNGRVIRTLHGDGQDHPGGGCRMGDDPASSVTDSFGRSHDHPNLFVVGAPTMVSGACCNGTLTFAALSLRSADEIGRELPARSD